MSADVWSQSLRALRANLQKLHGQLRQDGITGMSHRNLRQIVSTRGVTVPPSTFDRLFSEALRVLPAGFVLSD